MLPQRRSYFRIDRYIWIWCVRLFVCFCASLCERLDVAGERCSLPCMYWLSMIKQNNKSRKSSVMNRIFRSEIKWKAAQSELRNTTEIYAKVLAMWKLVSRLLFVISQLNNRRSAYYKHIRIQRKKEQPALLVIRLPSVCGILVNWQCFSVLWSIAITTRKINKNNVFNNKQLD